jgi:hypothetical protein
VWTPAIRKVQVEDGLLDFLRQGIDGFEGIILEELLADFIPEFSA